LLIVRLSPGGEPPSRFYRFADRAASTVSSLDTRELGIADTVRALVHPSGLDPERFHLIAPDESNPERWTDIE
jgi:hypothetical protein